MVKFGNDWDNLIAYQFDAPYYLKLRQFLIDEYQHYTIYPSMYDIFNALKLTSYADTKVVIVGQDPYHEPGQAHGLAFSVQEGIALPPSLKNIYKEIEDEFGIRMSRSGNLTKWAKQGVLLLNNVLTVRAGLANSHRNQGWEIFTDEVIRLLNVRKEPVIFVFWGNNAKAKMQLVTNPIHLVLTSAHPSPLSAYNGFFGCGHFRKINEF
ncbi:MAG: uracil-DNA glycosylase [Bacilli bacterium]|nr:uracil-DNA glycosylase [Bacilli bacterium]